MKGKRDCIFLVADGQLKTIFQTFLTLNHFHDKIGSAPFSFRPDDVIMPFGGRNDPNTYQRAHDFLRPYQSTHEHAVVVLDEAWGHSLTAEKIALDITRNLVQSGWPEDSCVVIVIRPELEAWIWQNSPNVDAAFYRNLNKAERDRQVPLRAWLCQQGLWPEGLAKPPDPKAAVLRARSAFRAGSQSAIYQSICQRISVQGCQDPAFRLLRETLCRWFPRGQE